MCARTATATCAFAPMHVSRFPVCSADPGRLLTKSFHFWHHCFFGMGLEVRALASSPPPPPTALRAAWLHWWLHQESERVSVVLDLDETLVQALTLSGFAERLEIIKKDIHKELDPHKCVLLHRYSWNPCPLKAWSI